MESLDFGRWEYSMVLVGAAIGVLAVGWRLWERSRSQRQRHRRIDAARSRSATLSMPLHSGSKGSGSGDTGGMPAAPRHAARPVANAALYDNPHPVLRLQYTDIYGQATDRVITVERLDLYRQAIVARGTEREDLRTLSLGRIRIARDAASGAHFSLNAWIERMRQQEAGEVPQSGFR